MGGGYEKSQIKKKKLGRVCGFQHFCDSSSPGLCSGSPLLLRIYRAVYWLRLSASTGATRSQCLSGRQRVCAFRGAFLGTLHFALTCQACQSLDTKRILPQGLSRRRRRTKQTQTRFQLLQQSSSFSPRSPQVIMATNLAASSAYESRLHNIR